MTPPTPTAARFELLFWSLTAICSFVTLVVLIAMVGLVLRFHHARDRGDAEPIRHHNRYEVAWTVVTFAVFAGMFVFGALAFRELDADTRETESPLEVSVTAKRWMWKFDHADGPREIDALHVPAGRPIRLSMISEDVIHSFFVPKFRLKHDVLPGRASTLVFRVDTPGNYQLLCAEYCGLDHSRMRGRVVVMTPDDYTAWRSRRSSQPEGDTP
ncbi:cytochrome c oxidase subunit II [Enhygromyxa salina]|uniref:cytochrome-c oxidase n=1 Tax=Enhygromyxa salina TaxID=215803 RepID=A0A2S9YPD0_9BACT|nr:cytochrome c oxidase subunit II [Enhygromyxa salina]PRQ06919.1 Alternative cytochrome c oxidase subunit 2 [Enhygromyxa salina]